MVNSLGVRRKRQHARAPTTERLQKSTRVDGQRGRKKLPARCFLDRQWPERRRRRVRGAARRGRGQMVQGKVEFEMETGSLSIRHDISRRGRDVSLPDRD